MDHIKYLITQLTYHKRYRYEFVDDILTREFIITIKENPFIVKFIDSFNAGKFDSEFSSKKELTHFSRKSGVIFADIKWTLDSRCNRGNSVQDWNDRLYTLNKIYEFYKFRISNLNKSS